jgi:hypothetical protein
MIGSLQLQIDELLTKNTHLSFAKCDTVSGMFNKIV